MSSSARDVLAPSELKKSCRSGASELNTLPSLAPSNAVMPIAHTSSAAVPRTGVRKTAPVIGGRAYSTPSWRVNGDSRANSEK